jgi:hypothetical protein
MHEVHANAEGMDEANSAVDHLSTIYITARIGDGRIEKKYLGRHGALGTTADTKELQ